MNIYLSKVARRCVLIERKIMNFKDLEERMEKTISVLRESLSEIRAGRANPAILNKITVEYYGVETPINQVA